MALNAQITSIFVLMPIIGFILTASICILDQRLQRYMEVFSASFLTYFILIWFYSLLTGAPISPLLEISLSGRPVELILYISAGTGMILGTLAVRLKVYQRLEEAIRTYS